MKRTADVFLVRCRSGARNGVGSGEGPHATATRGHRMIEYYKTSLTGVTERVTSPERGCWINVVQPTERERAWLQNEAGIVPEFVRSALDEEESSHIDYDDDADQVLIIVDCPSVEDEQEKETPTLTQYDTQPLSVLFLRDKGMLVTISLHGSVIVDDFAAGRVRQIDTTRRARFLLQLLLRISQQYLVYLRSIDRQFSKAEKQLHATMRNEELIKMLGLEKSLVYFSISLKADETTLNRIMGGRIIKLYEEDQELLDDVLIEIHQAMEMCKIYSDILTKDGRVQQRHQQQPEQRHARAHDDHDRHGHPHDHLQLLRHERGRPARVFDVAVPSAALARALHHRRRVLLAQEHAQIGRSVPGPASRISQSVLWFNDKRYILIVYR